MHLPVQDVVHDDEEAVSPKAPWKPEDSEWWLGGPRGPVMRAPLPGPVSHLLCALVAGTSEVLRRCLHWPCVPAGGVGLIMRLASCWAWGGLLEIYEHQCGYL